MPVIKREATETTVDPYLPNIAMILEEAHKLNVHVPTASIYLSGHPEVRLFGFSSLDAGRHSPTLGS
jgi:hypothetical protein